MGGFAGRDCFVSVFIESICPRLLAVVIFIVVLTIDVCCCRREYSSGTCSSTSLMAFRSTLVNTCYDATAPDSEVSSFEVIAIYGAFK